MFSKAGARHCQGEQPARRVRGIARGYEGLRRCLLPLMRRTSFVKLNLKRGQGPGAVSF
jgi:hypothetical protein